ncbi:MAG TPA: electron transfer flavoprotein subunit beta, partial [Porphyromonadaceae bacterium]|nr:electron transfer flavoprotein subunit beta [Porphyromonadaceae bacterium]
KFKHAKTVTERQSENIDYIDIYSTRPYLNLTEWGVADVDADIELCGLSGSPTKVKKIENVVFQTKESKHLSGSDDEIEQLMIELIANHTIG